MYKNSSDSFQREQYQGLNRMGSQRAEEQRTITGIQKAEAFQLNKNMMKTCSYNTDFSRDFLGEGGAVCCCFVCFCFCFL